MLCMYFGYVGKVEDREKAARVERRLMYCLGACPLCLMLLLHTGCKGLQAPSFCSCPPPSDLCEELTRELACAGCGRYVSLMKWNEQLQTAFKGILVPATMPYPTSMRPALAWPGQACQKHGRTSTDLGGV